MTTDNEDIICGALLFIAASLDVIADMATSVDEIAPSINAIARLIRQDHHRKGLPK
jgi:hypothetical protein